MTESLTLRVAAKTRVAETVTQFELVAADGADLPPFTAGAHLRVWTPSGPVRAYSLCNDPAESGRYVIGVHREPASRGGSQAMHERLHAGDVIAVEPPQNHFPLDEQAPHSILVAGGIGITPLLAMAWRLHRLGASFALHYAARSEARCAFAVLLRSAPFAGRVHLHFDDGSAGAPLDVPRLLSQAPDGTQAYVCGPSGLIDHVLEAGRAQGWPDRRLHHERFGAAPAPAAGARAFRIVLAHSGLSLEVPADRSVASVIQAAGVDLPMSCEQGVCGTCITDVLDGRPEHRDQCLTDADRARCFTPCCSRALSDTLTLAL